VINVKVWVHFWLFVLGLIQVIYMAIDPRSLYLIIEKWKGWLYELWDNAANSWAFIMGIFLLSIYGCIFSDIISLVSRLWTCLTNYRVDLYNVAITSLKREDMLIKINANYKGKDLTVEEVVTKVKFLNKLKWPFVALMSFLTIFQWVWSILKGLNIPWYELELSFYVYCILQRDDWDQGLTMRILSTGFYWHLDLYFMDAVLSVLCHPQCSKMFERYVKKPYNSLLF
jgi:hypothetical protein